MMEERKKPPTMHPLEMQARLRQNAETTSAYVRDLFKWEERIEKEDEKLKESPTPVRKLPPIRGKEEGLGGLVRPSEPAQVSSPITSSDMKESSTSRTADEKDIFKTKGKPIKPRSYEDYHMWDKFDPDAAEVEVVEESTTSSSARKSSSSTKPPTATYSSSSSSIKIEEISSEDTRDEAEKKKEKEEKVKARLEKEAESAKNEGNALFRKGKFNDAIRMYVTARKLNPNNSAVCCNLGAAYLQMKRYEEAEKACSDALSLNPEYGKAYYRRGAARKELGKLEGAIEDFRSVLRLNPNEKLAKGDLRDCIETLKKKEAIPKRRMQIVEEDAVEDGDGVRVVGSEIVEGSDDHRTFKIEEEDKGKEEEIEELSTPGAERLMIIEENERQDEVPIGSVSTSSQSGDEAPLKKKPKKGLAAERREVHVRPSLPDKPPNTFYEFEHVFRSFKDDVQALGKYIGMIVPSNLPSLFRQSLDIQILACFIHVVKDVFLPQYGHTLPISPPNFPSS
eukprot:TRINITY_DN1648_c0_g2_i1.p1 TRINITY_DN1648_c0_g2~~TRINITY_DN1648_c0_g2_i1.p1  ORF type:complete len:508 (+),score=176.79 TRINITY_DN1648_c0_g2_i1:160-1683(+)